MRLQQAVKRQKNINRNPFAGKSILHRSGLYAQNGQVITCLYFKTLTNIQSLVESNYWGADNETLELCSA
jgi:hypothetical protein